MNNYNIVNLENEEYFISILVINFNGQKYLGEILDNCIKSILDVNYNKFELLFIDNGSIDGSVDHIRKLYGDNEKLKIIELNKNYGTTGAKNIGIKKSKGELIYLLNNDIYLKKDTLKIMNNVLRENPQIGILSCKLVTPEGEVQSEGESFYVKFSLIGSIFPSLYRRLYLKRLERRGNLNLVEWISGGALMVRKKLFDNNMYDENYFMYSEEVDLAYRVKGMGYEVACINDFKTIHYGKLTSKHFSKWTRDLESRNQLLFIRKNFSKQRLAISYGYYILSIFNNFIVSLIKRDKLELLTAFSKIAAFSYVNKPPIVPKG